MSLILAQSFMKQLKRLPAREQGLVSTQVLDLQADPTAARHSLHRVDGNAGWWSAYVNGDLRIILRREEDGTMVLCWTDHHDAAYLWARRHQLMRHPVTGAMQLVEIPEVRAQPQPVGTVPAPEPTRPRRCPCEALQITREDLLRLGVPEIWIDPVLQAEDEDALLDIGEYHLPPLAAEAVLKIAVGERPEVPEEDESPAVEAWNPQDWWVLSEDDDLKAALENENWDSWCVYLHPSQRAIARKLYKGPYRVCGSAGTGKTVVALHHAKYILEQQPESRVLIMTFSENLADDLRRRCVPLLSPRQLERCEVRTLEAFALDLYDRVFPGHATVIDPADLHDLAIDTLVENQERLPKGISCKFALSEFERIIEPRRIGDEEAYLKARRRGVHVRLAAERRRQIWSVMRTIYDELALRGGLVTEGQVCQELAAYLMAHDEAPRERDARAPHGQSRLRLDRPLGALRRRPRRRGRPLSLLPLVGGRTEIWYDCLRKRSDGMQTMLNVREAKADFSKILSHIEKDMVSVTIMRSGRPIARLSPITTRRSVKPMRKYVGKVRLVGDACADTTADWEALHAPSPA